MLCLVITQEVVDSGMAESCGESVNVALPMLVSVLEPPSYSDDAADTAYCLTRTIKALSILSDILSSKVMYTVESAVRGIRGVGRENNVARGKAECSIILEFA